MNETTRQEGAAPQKHTDRRIDRPNTKNIRHLREHGATPCSDLPVSKVSARERQAGVWKFGLAGASPRAVSGGGHTEPVYYIRDRHAPEAVVRTWCRTNPGFLAERSLRSARTRLQETGSEFHDAIRTVLAEQGEWGGDELVTDGGTPHATELTQFKINVLNAIGQDTPYGLQIKRRLQAYYGTEVLHGRLYPNLDELVEMGLVEKRERDKRTNEYELSPRGRQLLRDRVEWLSNPATDEQRVTGTDTANAAVRADGGDEQ